VVWRDLRGHVSGMWLSVLEEPGRGEEIGKLTLVDGTMWNSSILVLVYAYAMFQKRLTMIGTRDAGQFGASCSSLLHHHPLLRRSLSDIIQWIE
jgi:hypothetical protein